jgi:hypothetical protein
MNSERQSSWTRRERSQLQINTMKNQPTQFAARSRVLLQRLVSLCGIAFRAWLDVALWVPSFAFKNVFFIERQGGPITYLFTVIILIPSPLIGASCGVAQALLAVDEEPSSA